jgi:hypothetical protein
VIAARVARREKRRLNRGAVPRQALRSRQKIRGEDHAAVVAGNEKDGADWELCRNGIERMLR